MLFQAGKLLVSIDMFYWLVLYHGTVLQSDTMLSHKQGRAYT